MSIFKIPVPVHSSIVPRHQNMKKQKPGPKSSWLFTTVDRGDGLPSGRGITARGRTGSKFKRWIRKFSVPGEAEAILMDRLKKLRWAYANEREYVESLISYDLWAEKDHLLTGPAFQSRADRARLWEEIIRDYGKPNKTGSFFEHRLEEFAKQKINLAVTDAKQRPGFLTRKSRK